MAQNRWQAGEQAGGGGEFAAGKSGKMEKRLISKAVRPLKGNCPESGFHRGRRQAAPDVRCDGSASHAAEDLRGPCIGSVAGPALGAGLDWADRLRRAFEGKSFSEWLGERPKSEKLSPGPRKVK